MKVKRTKRGKRLVMQPLFRLRIVKDKTKYNRKKQEKVEE